MSTASERRAMRALLPTYSLMTVPETARHLGSSEEVVREMLDRGTIPSVRVGQRRHVDPMDLVAYILAGREGVTVADFWAQGDAAVERIRRYLVQVRRVSAA